jgi:hypothetical protein
VELFVSELFNFSVIFDTPVVGVDVGGTGVNVFVGVLVGGTGVLVFVNVFVGIGVVGVAEGVIGVFVGTGVVGVAEGVIGVFVGTGVVGVTEGVIGVFVGTGVVGVAVGVIGVFVGTGVVGVADGVTGVFVGGTGVIVHGVSKTTSKHSSNVFFSLPDHLTVYVPGERFQYLVLATAPPFLPFTSSHCHVP